MTTLLEPPPLPREHGAWAMLALPNLIGLAAAWPPARAAWLLPPAMALLFLSRYAGVVAGARVLRGSASARGYTANRLVWTAIYGAGALLFVAAAFAGTRAGSAVAAGMQSSAPATRQAFAVAAAVTLLLGGAHTALALARLDHTIGGELVGMAGLASAAPLIMAASGRPIDGRAFAAAAFVFLYFVSGLVYVRAVRGRLKDDRGPWRGAIVAHLFIALAIARLWALSWIPAWLPLAFAPVFARTAWGYLSTPASLRVLGWREIGVATAFGLVAIASYVA